MRKNPKKNSCAPYITPKLAKNPIFRAHNLKYLKFLTWWSDSDSTSKITPETAHSFSATKPCRPVLLLLLWKYHNSYFISNMQIWAQNWWINMVNPIWRLGIYKFNFFLQKFAILGICKISDSILSSAISKTT